MIHACVCVCVCVRLVYTYSLHLYIWHTHVHALMNNSDIQTCLRLVIRMRPCQLWIHPWSYHSGHSSHSDKGSDPSDPRVSFLQIHHRKCPSKSSEKFSIHSTVVFQRAPLIGIFYDRKPELQTILGDIQGSRGLRMFSSTNLRRRIMIVSTMPSTVKSKKYRPSRMSSSKPLILRKRRKIWRNKDHVSTQSWG